jgi:hypothetical protein
VGPIVYRFEVSDSSSFGGNLIFVADPVSEQPAQTSTQVTVRLNSNGTYYWRVQAHDVTNNISSPYSAIFSFKYVPFDMRQATIYDSPPDLGSWDVTANITSVEFIPDCCFKVDFDRRTGPNRWRDLDAGFGNRDALQYTLGMCRIETQPACSAVVQFWFERPISDSTPPSYVGRNWFYDGRWGSLLGYQPQNGEQVGLFAGTGNLRDKTYSGAQCPQICERTNVAIVTWHNDDTASFTFTAGGMRTLGLRRR